MSQTEDRSELLTNHKEPWLAVNLSKILPGIGQIYAGKSIRGYTIILTWLLLLTIGFLLLINPGTLPIGGGLLIFCLVILPIWNLFDAYYLVKKINAREFESERKQHKDPWLAVFLSSFIPGLGHAYLHQWLSAIIFIVVFIAAFVAANLQNATIVIIAKLLQFVLGFFILYNVYVSTPVRRERSHRTILLFIMGIFGGAILISATLALLIRHFIAETRYIPSGAMLPTLQINDRLIINKLIYRFSNPVRGDIVVFNPTAQLEKEKFKDAFIKRIIGLPGDRIDVKDGKVYINGKVLTEKYLDEAPAYNWSSTALTPDGIVPEGHYLVLGDNRNNSYDSHYWGFVPRQNIIGKATNRFYPVDRAGSIVVKQ